MAAAVTAAMSLACSGPADQRPGSTSTTAERPSATTTGVPPGVDLEPSRRVTVTEDGQVVDGLHVTGSIVVDADDVTIRRSLVEHTGDGYAITLEDGRRNLMVEDSEIDGSGSSSRQAAICCSDYTLRRVDVHGVTEGPRLGSDVVVEDSYIHDLRTCDDCHVDALQTTGGSNIVIRNNSVDSTGAESDAYGNAALMFGEDTGEIREVLVEGNYFNGGNYTLNGGRDGAQGAEIVFRNNRFGRDSRYGAAANLGDAVDLDATNVWDDTGEPVQAGQDQ